jgi:hypothetical protein
MTPKTRVYAPFKIAISHTPIAKLSPLAGYCMLIIAFTSYLNHCVNYCHMDLLTVLASLTGHKPVKICDYFIITMDSSHHI